MISVVIPVYNKSKTIVRCLESVISQSSSPVEIIIINDGSLDDSYSVIQEWIRKIKTQISINLISNENKGVSYSRNLGIKKSKSNYIALLDADDYWEKDFLINMKKVITQFPNIALATCKHRVEDAEIGTFTPEQIFGFETIGVTENYLRLAQKYPIVNSSKIVLNRKYFDQTGGFPDGIKVSEDLFLWIKLSQLAPFGYCDKTLVTIYQESDNSRNSRIGEVPYPILYFSKKTRKHQLSNDLKKLLWSIHLKHILGSCVNNKEEAWYRIRAGLKLFPLKAPFLISMIFIPKYIFKNLRRIRRKRLKYLYEKK